MQQFENKLAFAVAKSRRQAIKLFRQQLQGRMPANYQVRPGTIGECMYLPVCQ